MSSKGPQRSIAKLNVQTKALPVLQITAASLQYPLNSSTVFAIGDFIRNCCSRLQLIEGGTSNSQLHQKIRLVCLIAVHRMNEKCIQYINKASFINESFCFSCWLKFSCSCDVVVQLRSAVVHLHAVRLIERQISTRPS